MNNHQFRTDINGLRAYAVILVVLFHSFVAQIPNTMILLYLFLLKFSQTS